MTTEIIYTIENNDARGEVVAYHHKPNPRRLHRGAKHKDIAQLKTKDKMNLLKLADGDYSTKFTIGFEVEKNSLSRGAVKEYPLFCGFERDGSCGYEAVTNILPLLPSGIWRTKVFNMMFEATKIIDDEFSPSDKRCGGHCTIGVDGMSGNEIRQAMRKNCGILLALFRKRLNTKYCGSNRRMQGSYEFEDINSWSGSYDYGSNQIHTKYQTALVKYDCFEFRLPSRFENVKQMMRRYELFYELVDFSINKPNGTHAQLLKNIKPIIVAMYDGNVEKAEEILKMAVHFRKFILDGTIDPSIAEFLR
jgi:hypothetical protein